MSDRLRVLIVGASIAGPATAYWLAKTGASITIIERYPEFRKGGQNVNIRSTAVKVMRKIPGMEEAVKARHVQCDSFEMLDGYNDNRSLGKVEMSSNPEQQSLLSQYEIFRDNISEVLHNLTKDDPNITYIYNEQVTQMHNSADGGPVTVDFMNGHPSAEYDLVVACDGATSRTRALGLNCGVRDYVHPLNVWVAYLSIDEDLLQGNRTGLSQSAIKGRVITVVPDIVGKSVRSAMICAYPPHDTTSLSKFHQANKSLDSLKALVQETFEDIPGEYVPKLLAHMRASPDFYAGEVVQVKVPSLYRDRFTMVGDAGYAPGFAGTGTTLALTGAYVLAGEISRHKGDLDAGLQGYEERMRPIIEKMQKLPPGGMAIFAPQTGWGLWFRNTVYSLVVRSGIADFAQKRLFSQSAGLDEFSLEDYMF